MRDCISGRNVVYRLLVVLFFITVPFIASAQDLPCNDADPFADSCPLDTWVIALVVIAGILTPMQLHSNNKKPLDSHEQSNHF